MQLRGLFCLFDFLLSSSFLFWSPPFYLRLSICSISYCISSNPHIFPFHLSSAAPLFSFSSYIFISPYLTLLYLNSFQFLLSGCWNRKNARIYGFVILRICVSLLLAPVSGFGGVRVRELRVQRNGKRVDSGRWCCFLLFFFLIFECCVSFHFLLFLSLNVYFNLAHLIFSLSSPPHRSFKWTKRTKYSDTTPRSPTRTLSTTIEGT